jgi:hypothetical protein
MPDGLTLALEREIEGLRAQTAEIKATLEGKEEATTAAPRTARWNTSGA